MIFFFLKKMVEIRTTYRIMLHEPRVLNQIYI